MMNNNDWINFNEKQKSKHFYFSIQFFVEAENIFRFSYFLFSCFFIPLFLLFLSSFFPLSIIYISSIFPLYRYLSLSSFFHLYFLYLSLSSFFHLTLLSYSLKSFISFNSSLNEFISLRSCNCQLNNKVNFHLVGRRLHSIRRC